MEKVRKEKKEKDEFPITLSIKSFAQRKKTCLSKGDLSRKGIGVQMIPTRSNLFGSNFVVSNFPGVKFLI